MGIAARSTFKISVLADIAALLDRCYGLAEMPGWGRTGLRLFRLNQVEVMNEIEFISERERNSRRGSRGI